MAYYKFFTAETAEAAVAAAKEYIAKSDMVTQASLWSVSEKDGQYVATVQYWGYD